MYRRVYIRTRRISPAENKYKEIKFPFERAILDF